MEFFEPPPVTITLLKSVIPNYSALIFSDIIFPSTNALKVSPGFTNYLLSVPLSSIHNSNLESWIGGVISGYSKNIPIFPWFPGWISFINLSKICQSF